jgi:putative Mg2+ transporter-C (MgtC) family protein
MEILRDEGWREQILPALIRLLLAGGYGGLIGVERELRGKAAGFRTNVVISLGAAVFMMVSERVAGPAGVRAGDPARIAAQVVTGVGFLGAGAIIQSGGHVRGMTSAAMIWVVAAVGMAAGAGYAWLAGIATLLTLLTNSLLREFERRVLERCDAATCRLRFSTLTDATRQALDEVFREHEVRLERVSLEPEGQGTVVTFEYCQAHDRHRRVLGEIWRLPGVSEVRHVGPRRPIRV